MAKNQTFLAVFSVLLLAGVAVGTMGDGETRPTEESMFILNVPRVLVATEAGMVSLLRSSDREHEMVHMTMERKLEMVLVHLQPNTFTAPLYIDSHLTIFVRQGHLRMRLAMSREDGVADIKLKTGDIFHVTEGTVFYIVNPHQQETLDLLCAVSMNFLNHLILGRSKLFFIGGGIDSSSALSGFDWQVLSTAFNVSVETIAKLLTQRTMGPIMRMTMNMSTSILNSDASNAESDTFSMFKKKKDFYNDYGWTLAVDRHDYSHLKYSDVGMFYVNLSAGAMMAPHYNSKGAEYAMVMRGEGRIVMGYPNGTCAMDIMVKKGDAFWVPRYYPVCQIAGMHGDFEFVGFTTSSSKEQPRFLTGTNSVMWAMKSHLDALSQTFGIHQDMMYDILTAQQNAVILPPMNMQPIPKMDFSVSEM